QADPSAELTWRDLRPVLDEELARLPAKYRLPVLLCYLEGRTNEEAARQLGWTKGTVSGRLARARSLLRARLERRGLAPGAALLGTALAGEAATAAVPAALARATVAASLRFAAGSTAAALPGAAALAQGMLRTTVAAKARSVTGAVLALAL